ncbi:HAMP domain-containing protein [Acetobacterium paludosum]|uniref:HAMP domain-containing protein n=1 Tax=Acetobacterium paludosum TaxID=52693 RepID=A0A923HTS4_9FIRM|nr:methyl-accepting chemotaxis protein [Acetobacterium paludosum]MBC3887125.1 HAMP domain-containing protein [Acetobacterium paludosum]
MKWFYNMKIRRKLLVGFSIVAFVIVIVGIIGVTSIEKLQQSDFELYENMMVPVEQVSQIEIDFMQMRISLREMILSNDSQVIKEKADKIAEMRKEIDTVSEELKKSLQSDEEKAASQEFVDSQKEYIYQVDPIMALAIQNQDEEANALASADGLAVKAAVAEQNAIDKLQTMKLEGGKAKADANALLANNVITTMIIFILLGVLLAIALEIFIGTVISKPLIRASHMLQEMSKGHLGERLNMDTKDEIGLMAVAMDYFADDLQNVVIGTMNQISEGDVSAYVEIKDAQDEISPALKKTIETIRTLIIEATMLSQAAIEGRLDTRGNAEAFNGGYKEIVQGVNQTLDAVVGPLNVAAEYMERISKGDIPAKITDSYNGDFNSIKNNLNTCIDAVNALVADAGMLEKAGVEGRLNTRADASKHGGDFAKIVDGVNNTLDAVVGPLNVAAEYVAHISKGEIPTKITDNYNGEFNTIKNNLNICIDAVNALVEDATILAQAGIDGNLNTRADVSKHQGDFARIVDGVNATLDAVVAPVQEASATLKELAQGNLNTAMVGNYNGDYTLIKDNMNQTVAFLKRYVDEITFSLEELGQGNLDQHITTEYLGDFLAIKNALNGITATLSTIMGDINEAAGQVEAGATQISDGGQALSQGTTEQASSIQELTASIQEVAQETKQNAVHANETSELATAVRTNAVIGNDQMKEMVTAMLEINDSSKSISKIIKVIDDIAFQTNILALNAAVEAARAGQQGKGFAVVAEEVRSLAARSAEAAKETTGLIEGSIDKVEVGTKIVDQTAESLKAILDEIEKVTSLVEDIARASNDQASEIAQINQGIEQVSQVVQTNSATAEESAAASEELSGQAEILKQMVGAFKLKTDGSIQKNIHEIKKKNDSIPATELKILLDNTELDKY